MDKSFGASISGLKDDKLAEVAVSHFECCLLFFLLIVFFCISKLLSVAYFETKHDQL